MLSSIKQLPLLVRPALQRGKGDERYLIIRPTPDGAQALLLRLDPERVLQFEQFWPSFSWDAFAHAYTPHRFLPNVILAAHPSGTATVSIPMRLDRAKETGPLAPAEFETFLRQMHVKLWNEHRDTAATMLGVERMNTVLVDVRVTELAVEGREVLHPFELSGSRIDLRFMVTFTTRGIFESWQKLFNLPKGFLFTDVARAALQSLEGMPDAPRGVVVSDAWGTSYAHEETVRGQTWVKQAALNWNGRAFPDALRDLWQLDPASAEAIHAAYASGTTSLHAGAFIRNAYEPYLDLLDKALKSTRVKGPVAFMSSVPFPEPLPTVRSGVRFDPFPLESLMQRFDFTLAPHADLPFDIAAYIAPLVEFYYHNRYAEVNRWFKHRVHWLIPSHA